MREAVIDPAFAALPSWKQKQARARATVLEVAGGEGATFVSRYNSGAIEVSEDVRRVVPRISRSVLYRWRDLYHSKGVLGLVETRGRTNSKAQALARARAEKLVAGLGGKVIWDEP